MKKKKWYYPKCCGQNMFSDWLKNKEGKKYKVQMVCKICGKILR